jgi:hypothetical protein
VERSAVRPLVQCTHSFDIAREVQVKVHSCYSAEATGWTTEKPISLRISDTQTISFLSSAMIQICSRPSVQPSGRRDLFSQTRSGRIVKVTNNLNLMQMLKMLTDSITHSSLWWCSIKCFIKRGYFLIFPLRIKKCAA